jgi:hypothetical protein
VPRIATSIDHSSPGGASFLLVRCEFWSTTFPPRRKYRCVQEQRTGADSYWFWDWELRYSHVLRRYRDSSRLADGFFCDTDNSTRCFSYTADLSPRSSGWHSGHVKLLV